MQQTVAKCVHPNTVVKIENKSFFVLAWLGLYQYEVDALQHTWLPQCSINKSHKRNAFFIPNFVVSQLPINSWNTKLLETVSKFHRYLLFCTMHYKVLFIHSIAKQYNFINIVQKHGNVFAQLVWNMSWIFHKSKLFGVLLHPLRP